ncbi:MAG: hypothetical protein V4690_01250 [Patescibacteria group bacterium]
MDFLSQLGSGDITAFIKVALQFFFYAIFFAIPVFLIKINFDLWMRYRRGLFFNKQEYIVLEIKPPKDVFKSPRATEFFINGMWDPGSEGTFLEKHWKGKLRMWQSLEIVSLGGVVKFLAWVKKGDKNKIEANLYSQYPGIEIYEQDDYSLEVTYTPEVNDIWATEFDLTKPDAYPIKTYIDYGLEKDPKEEYKLDPITPLIEAMGAIPPGHQAWFQIIIRGHKAENVDPVTGKLVDLKWQKGAEEEINKIIAKTKGDKDAEGKPVPGTNRSLTSGESDIIAALERSVSKSGFDVGMRMMYIANKDVFNMANIGGLVGGVMHFNSSLNGFKPSRGFSSKKPKDLQFEKKAMLDAYKKRSYFYKIPPSPYFVLNTEELATIFHFPGSVAGTPTFSRTESRKAEPPSNLPI